MVIRKTAHANNGASGGRLDAPIDGILMMWCNCENHSGGGYAGTVGVDLDLDLDVDVSVGVDVDVEVDVDIDVDLDEDIDVYVYIEVAHIWSMTNQDSI